MSLIIDRRYKLTPDQRQALARRYFARKETRETEESIALDFGVTRTTMRKIARQVGEEAPVPVDDGTPQQAGS